MGGQYLRHHDDVTARHPDLAGRPHWNLWMRNGPDGGGLFAVLAFWPHGMDFYCGTGDGRRGSGLGQRERA